MAFDKHKAMQMAAAYIQQGKWDRAIAEYQSVVKNDPRSITIYNTLGDIYLKLGNKAEAVAQYTKLGEAYSTDGLYAKATAIYKKIQNVDPQDYKIYMTLGELYSLQGLMGEAKAQYLAAANYLDKTNQKKEALGVYQKIADLDPSSFTVRIKIGEMFLREKMVPQAAEQFLRVAQGYLENNQREEARPYLARVVQLDPGNLEARKNLGQIYMERGEGLQAAEVLEPALSAAPEDPGLLTTLGTLYLQTQQKEKARSCLEKVVSQDPAHQEARQTLGRLFLSEENYDSAFTHLELAAKALAQSGQLEEAQGLYRGLLNQNPRYAPARQALAELLVQGGEAEKALSEYKIAAGLYREAGRNTEAAGFYKKILQIKPDDVVALKGLEALKEALAPPAGAELEAPVEEPTTISLVEEVGGISEELGLPSLEEIPLVVEEEKPQPEVAEGEEEPLVFKLESPPETIVRETKEPIAIEGIELVPPVETLEGPLEEEVPLEEGVTEFVEEDPVIAEHLIEADVYLKYGLTDRAVDLLQGLIGQNPHNISLRLKLKKIYQEKGQKDLVAKESLALAEIFVQKGERQMAEEELKAVLALEPDNSIALLRLKALAEQPRVEVPSAEAAMEEVPALVAEAPLAELELTPLEEAPAEVLPETAEGIPVVEEPGMEIIETLEGVPLELLEPEEIPKELLEKPGETIELLAAPPEEAEMLAEPAEAVEEKAPAVSLDEELALARFYRQQGLKEEAQEILHQILSQEPQHTAALHELTVLEQEGAPVLAEGIELVAEEPLEIVSPVAAPEAMVTEGEEPLTMAAEEAVELVSPPEAEVAEVPIPEIPLPFLGLPAEPQLTPPEAEITPQFSVAPPITEVEGGAFVDIGAELEEELVETPKALPDTKARTLSMDEIFQEFKKGVQQQLSPEDFETHYNLGIAYKEMGLLDEAIAEFQLAAKGSNRFLDSSSMLGMCFVEKGLPELAIRQYQKVLSHPELKEEETISVRFDLGLVYEKVGSLKKALESYMQVYAMDAKFRNVAGKINALKNKLAQGDPGGEEPGEKLPPPPSGGPPPQEPPPTPPAGGSKKVSYV